MVERETQKCVCQPSFLDLSSFPLGYCKSKFQNSMRPRRPDQPSISWYGWSAQAKIHWIMPIIGTGIFGFGKQNFITSTCSEIERSKSRHDDGFVRQFKLSTGYLTNVAQFAYQSLPCRRIHICSECLCCRCSRPIILLIDITYD